MGLKFQKVHFISLKKDDRVIVETGEHAGKYGKVVDIEMDWLIGEKETGSPYWINVLLDDGNVIATRSK